MPRVISTIASATEIICALGCEEFLVGRSHECDYPTCISRLPVCSMPKIDVLADSRSIDLAVKNLVKEGISIYEIDAALIHELQPDLIITQSQCEVCAVSGNDIVVALRDWSGPRPHVFSVSPNNLSDVWGSILEIAEVLGVEEQGRLLVERLSERVSAVAHKLSGAPTVSVCCIEWLEPLMAAGNWIPELVALAGGREVLGAVGRHSDWLSWEELLKQDPDYLVLMPCGFNLERATKELSSLLGNPLWHKLSAVRNEKVFIVDSNYYFTRPGPRLVESVEILAEIFHPGYCSFGHRDRCWIKLFH